MANLQPEDVVILLKLVAIGERKWTYESLAVRDLRMSPATVHRGVKTAIAAKLFDKALHRPIRRNLHEFLIHGIKYAFPAERGPIVPGIPTSWAASPLALMFPPTDQPVPVWPSSIGVVRGAMFKPLHKEVDKSALADPVFHELLALVDAIRDGGARIEQAATEELTKRLLG